jgi:hypothetical protein
MFYPAEEIIEKVFNVTRKSLRARQGVAIFLSVIARIITQVVKM